MLLRIESAGLPSLVGAYDAKRHHDATPDGFDSVCRTMGWDTQTMWHTLADKTKPWFLHQNGAYVYWNTQDGQWWIDEPTGHGVYVAKTNETMPPTDGWRSLRPDVSELPVVTVQLGDAKRLNG